MDNQPEPNVSARKKRCDACRFVVLARLDNTSLSRILQCRAAPPTAVLLQTGRGFTPAQVNPPVPPDFWCWSFARRAEGEAIRNAEDAPEDSTPNG